MVDNMWRFELCIVVSRHLYTSTETQLMKYNAEENDWVIQSVLPEKFRGAVCTVEWRGHIFVIKPCTHSRRSFGRQFCYLFNPSTNESIEIEVPENFAGVTVSAATVEI